MLELTSPEWAQLSHAYGDASDIPVLLDQLKTAPPSDDWQAEPWASLWSSMCHQGDVYTASYAAVPHIVAIAAAKPINEQIRYIVLVSSIAAMQHRKGAPTIPETLAPAYFDALEQSVTLILNCLKFDWNELEYKSLLGGLAAIRGHAALGMAIFNLEKEIDCPQCGAVFLANGYDQFGEVNWVREGVHQFIEEYAEYHDWLTNHPLGFVLLIRRDVPSEKVLLHRATCPTLQSDQIEQQYIKICSVDSVGLIGWTSRYGFISSIQHCSVCKPSR